VCNDRWTPFPATRQNISSASLRRPRNPDNHLVCSQLGALSVERDYYLSLDWNRNPALG
jgi:hypothetical protein